jgi:NADH-quinone oxidoreductase subunit G
MAKLVQLTIDGQPVEAPAGTLLIEAARRVGVEIPSFCYYEGLALQGACRMCLVEVERAPKLLTACTLPVTEGLVVRTATERVRQARRAVLEMLLTNHPLDCPVCDKGGECELQNMTLAHGPGVGRFAEQKHHVAERQWSAVVYYDRPRCILCFRCVRICDQGLGVRALSIIDRGTHSEIAPNRGDRLACDECGMCIDICPVGALTSRMYRYQTRPWEMQHVGAICTHCADGCKTTLGVYHHQIMRGNNRDRSGVNGEFLCIKGRYAADFVDHAERLTTPLMRTERGFAPVTWARAVAAVAHRLVGIKERGGRIGIAGSNHTTNEENYYLQKLARQGLATPHIDHHRTGDVASLVGALAGQPPLPDGRGSEATVADLYTSRAVLVVASDLAQQHPLLSYQIRFNYHHHGARIYVVTRGPVREDRYATRSLRVAPGQELEGFESLLNELAQEPELVILFGDAIRGESVARLVGHGESLGIPVKYVCLVDYSNSRGAADMGLLPDLGPGYHPLGRPGMNLEEMLAREDLGALWVIGANPLKHRRLAAKNAFVVVQDLFLTETAQAADIVLPAASAYEKTGTVTNTCGQVQRLARALVKPGPKPDLEIFRLIAQAMGLPLGPATPEAVFREIIEGVPGYDVGAAQTCPAAGPGIVSPAELIRSAGDTLFTSGTLGRYSKTLLSVAEGPGGLYQG